MADLYPEPSRDASTDGTAKKTSPFATRRGRLYGRKWQILIFKPAYTETENEDGTKTKTRDPEHDVAIDVSDLKCTFKTKATLDTIAAQTCTLVVYNMNAATEKEIIEEGFQISIFAGYEEGQYGQIYVGDIVQVFRNRENGTEYRLEIIALAGTANFSLNHVRSTIAAGSLPRDVPKILAQQSEKTFEVSEVSEELPEQPLPRGKVLFGTPLKYLRNLCVFHDAAFWQGEDGSLVVETIEQEIPEDKVLELTPATGLVGTPAYSDDGIHIKMLLDPRVLLRSLIKIDNEIIQRQAIAVSGSTGGQSGNSLPQQQQFDKDGEYQVFSVEHTGDTCGEDWTTSVIAASRNGRQGKLTAVSNSQTMH